MVGKKSKQYSVTHEMYVKLKFQRPEIKFYQHRAPFTHFLIVCGCFYTTVAIVTETKWPTKLKILAVQPCAEKGADPPDLNL